MPGCKALLVVPRFNGKSFWNFTATCELYGARFPAAPLGLITVAAMLPSSWRCRLVNRNAEELTAADLDWADVVMTGGMLPQRADTLRVIALAQARGRPVVVGGPDVTSSPASYGPADIRVLGEAEGVMETFLAAWNAGERTGVFRAGTSDIDVTRTPVPRFDLLKRAHYLYYGVQFSRGCPFVCEFCDIIELYGRVPRTKTSAQMLSELEALYRSGYRGHLDFVDDNFVGNRKAVKAFLPHLAAWQRERGYPFEFSTEASITMADDEALLALMREANFYTVFVGIESPDADTLVSMQKKQNARRSLAESVHRIHRAGVFVNGGFILGFDSEKPGAAEAMIECIDASAIPVCMVGLLYALPTTQLTRRLAAEGRLFEPSYTDQAMAQGAGDQCTSGLNFATARPRRDILADYRKVLERIYEPSAYFARVRRMARLLDRPVLDTRQAPARARKRIAGFSAHDLRMLGRLVLRIALRQPRALLPFLKAFRECARHNRRALKQVGVVSALYLHVGPFSRYVMSVLDRQIAEIDSGAWQHPPLAERPVSSMGFSPVARSSGRSPPARSTAQRPA